MDSIGSLLLLGFVLGMRHATDADHVVAVSAIASRERSVRSALLVGVSWGVGHACSVLIAGGALVLLKIVIPPRLGLGLELAVGLILVALGLSNLRGSLHHHHHRDGRGRSRAVEVPLGLLRSLGVGVVHGLAGSAGIALLIVAAIGNARSAVLYLLLFGVGTIAGMVSLTSVLAFPVAYAARRFEGAHRALAGIAGLVSLALGLFLVYRIGFVGGLFAGNASGGQ